MEDDELRFRKFSSSAVAALFCTLTSRMAHSADIYPKLLLPHVFSLQTCTGKHANAKIYSSFCTILNSEGILSLDVRA